MEDNGWCITKHLSLNREKKMPNFAILPLVLAVFCCGLICTTQIKENQVMRAREYFMVMDKNERHQWLLDYFWTHSKYAYKFNFCVNLNFVTGIIKFSFRFLTNQSKDVSCQDFWPNTCIDFVTARGVFNKHILRNT